MRIEIFDCGKCSRPFRLEANSPRQAMLCKNNLMCRACCAASPATRAVTLDALMQKPNLKRTDGGWYALGPLWSVDCDLCRRPVEEHRWCEECQMPKDCLTSCCKKVIPSIGDPESAMVRMQYAKYVVRYNRKLEYNAEEIRKFFAKLDLGYYGCGYCGEDFYTCQAVFMSCRMIACRKCRQKAGIPAKCTICPATAEEHKKHFQKHIVEVENVSKKEVRCLEGAPYKAATGTGDYHFNVAEKNCVGCTKSFEISELFSCIQCDRMILCGACFVRGHQDHKYVDLKQKNLAKVEKSITRFFVQHYDGLFGNIRGIHAEIEKDQEELLKVNEVNAKMISGQAAYADGMKIGAELIGVAEEFEKCFEAYLPHARMYCTNLQKLKETLEKST